MVEPIFFDPTKWGVDPNVIAVITQLERSAQDQNVSQEQLAELSGVSQGQISRIFSLKTSPTLASVSKLATALGKRIVMSEDGGLA